MRRLLIRCLRCRLALNSPADIQASCDLIERAVELDPELVKVSSFGVVCFYRQRFCLIIVVCAPQGTAQIFKLGVLFNRAEAEAYEAKLTTIPKKPPAKLPSPTDFTDSDDNIVDDEDDIFER